MGLLNFIVEHKKKKSGVQFPAAKIAKMESINYGVFKEEERFSATPDTVYEKLAKLSGNLLHIEPDKKAREKMEESIAFAHLKVTPKGVTSFAILIGLLFCLGTIFLLLLGYIDFTVGVILLMVSMALYYYLYTTPGRLRKIYELKAGSEIIMLILHIVIYMRNFPNLEGALKFATANLTGPLAYDMQKMIWDVDIGSYRSMEQALLAYSERWKSSFRSFSDSINAIIYSLYATGNRRRELLDEAIDIILTSLSERSNNYVINLASPVTLINALGILLPTLTLTMLPVITIFLEDSISPALIFVFYDIVLPIVLVFAIKEILDKRVVTLPEPDISLHPDLPPENKFRIGNFFVSSYFIGVVILMPFLYLWYVNFSALSLQISYVITLGFFISFAIIFRLSSFQKIKLRGDIVEMEDEFKELLFGLGQEIDRGIPLEVAIGKIMPTLKGHYASTLLKQIDVNIKYKNHTLEQAVFDEKDGAIMQFPSKLIYSVLKAIVDASNKGTKIVSEIMISISRYLKNLHKTQESIQEKFSEVIGSMQMQATILLPLICAIMNTLTYMMLEMFSFFGDAMGDMPSGSVGYAAFLSVIKEVPISASTFQLAIGFYALETIIILSWFTSGIQVGEDRIHRNTVMSRNLIIGGLVYVLVSFISLMVFIPFLDVIKNGLGT
ncbi:MAG: hypothetical protein DRP06_01325 [Candidatus Aenigmatarchaeota archaeon]|nr:MAG: hypothetical protein DRP06_01325 [Candidatus Aenigmarchaeota archaeon]